jgi:hypothetical protein
MHLSIRGCHTYPWLSSPAPSFFDIYDGKLKNLVELSTSEISGYA